MFFKLFTGENQLPGLSVSGTFVGNGLIVLAILLAFGMSVTVAYSNELANSLHSYNISDMVYVTTQLIYSNSIHEFLNSAC